MEMAHKDLYMSLILATASCDHSRIGTTVHGAVACNQEVSRESHYARYSSYFHLYFISYDWLHQTPLQRWLRLGSMELQPVHYTERRLIHVRTPLVLPQPILVNRNSH
jgi:hypothetical protein